MWRIENKLESENVLEKLESENVLEVKSIS